MLLFGAGASKDAGLPDAFQLTREVVGAISAADAHPETDVLSFVVGGLLYAQGARGTNPLEIDIEAVFRAIRWLEDRRSGAVDPSPFVAAGHGRVVEFDAFRREPLSPYDRTPSNAYGATNARLIRELGRILWRASPPTDYLSPITELLRRQRAVTIASLNYDNIVEVFCRRTGVRYTTGIPELSGWNAQKGYSFETIDEGITLLKLHGSLNWSMYSCEVLPDAAGALCPHRFVVTWGETAPDFVGRGGDTEPAVLFGGENKLVVDGPFLELFMRFRSELRRSTVLSVVGYSFRDSHINAEIATFLNRSNVSMRVVDPRPPEHSGFLHQLIRAAGNRIEMVREPAAQALLRLY